MNDDRIPNSIADPIIEAFQTVARASVESDRSLLNLINGVMERVIELEAKNRILEERVDMMARKVYDDHF